MNMHDVKNLQLLIREQMEIVQVVIDLMRTISY